MYKTLSAPLVAQVEISACCPNRCLHCYNYWRKNGKSLISCSDLSVNDIEKIMKQFAAHCVFHVVLTGGEPLLNKKALFRALELAVTHRITAGINSTLFTLTRNEAQRFKELCVSVVLTSLMGPTAEIHDNIAQRPSAFAKTLYGIRLLQEAGIRVSVNMVVSQKNKNFVRETALLVKSLGLKHFSSTRAGCPGNCPDFSELSLSLTEFREYLETLYCVGLEEQMAAGVLESYPLCGIKEVARYRAFIGRRCLAGVTTLTVASDGTVRPCSHLDIHYGNLLYEELSDIWVRMAMWRNGSQLPHSCYECKVLPWCGGGCRMEAKMRNGSLSSPDPYQVPEDVEYVFSELTAPKERDHIHLPNSFFVNPKARWRREKFGGVVFVGPRFACYLNVDAMRLLDGLDIKQSYQIDDFMSYPDVTKKFFENLFEKKILKSV